MYLIFDRKGWEIKFECEIVVKIFKFFFFSVFIGLGVGVIILYMGLWFNRKFGISLESIGGFFVI